MRHSLENEYLKIGINERGAELASLVSKNNGLEYIWQADPAVWGSSAPVLFPIIGNLRGGATTIDGQQYRIPKHGMIRHNENLELYYHGEDRITFRLVANESTRAVYPYDFDFRVTFRLRNEHLIVYHEVMNRGNTPMYFNLGGHPAFRVPLRPGERYEDYFLRFEEAEDSRSYQVTDEGTISNDTRPVPWQAGNILPLTHELFAHDALVFKDLNSHSVNLESLQTGPVLKVDYAGWTHLGIWAKTDGDFVCIEPWIGLADPAEGNTPFTEKEAIIELAAGETYEMSYDVKIL